MDDVRAVAAELPRSYEVVVRGGLSFASANRLALVLHDQTVMGLSFPKELREPSSSRTRRVSLPDASNMRFNWVDVLLETITLEEMQEFVVDAWATVVPKFVIADYAATHPV